MLLTEGRTHPNNINGCMKLEIRAQTHAQIPVPTREGILEETREETRGINGTLEQLLARRMACISRQRCRGTGRHGKHIDTHPRRWVPRSTPETFRGSRDHLGPLRGRVASLSRFPTSHRPLVRWKWEDRDLPKCTQDAKSPGMEENITRSGLLSLSTKRIGCCLSEKGKRGRWNYGIAKGGRGPPQAVILEDNIPCTSLNMARQACSEGNRCRHSTHAPWMLGNRHIGSGRHMTSPGMFMRSRDLNLDNTNTLMLVHHHLAILKGLCRSLR